MHHKYPGRWLTQNSKRWKRQSRNITRATQIGRKLYRWETNNKLLPHICIYICVCRITRGRMLMGHFLGMRFWRWRLSPTWRVELMETARASMNLYKNTVCGSFLTFNMLKSSQVPEPVEQDQQCCPWAQHQGDAGTSWPASSWSEVNMFVVSFDKVT